MLAGRHILHQFFQAIAALNWIAIPYEGRGGTIELGEALVAIFGVVRSVVEFNELVGTTGGDVDAGKRNSRGNE